MREVSSDASSRPAVDPPCGSRRTGSGTSGSPRRDGVRPRAVSGGWRSARLRPVDRPTHAPRKWDSSHVPGLLVAGQPLCQMASRPVQKCGDGSARYIHYLGCFFLIVSEAIDEGDANTLTSGKPGDRSEEHT